jgi:dihydrofolate reductase
MNRQLVFQNCSTRGGVGSRADSPLLLVVPKESVRRGGRRALFRPRETEAPSRARQALAHRDEHTVHWRCHRARLANPDENARKGTPMRVVVINHLTLDGVMQAPGRREEDTRDGFELGGWAGPNIDDVVNAAMGARMPRSGGLLLGRRSYEDMLSFWNTQDSPFKDMLNSAPKHVASRRLREPLPWPNSTLLNPDIAGAVAQLKQQPGGDLNVMGSGELIQTLMRHDLIDEYLLLIHPLVLGTGRRLFGDGGPPATLRLVDSTASTTGVLIATYQPKQLE